VHPVIYREECMDRQPSITHQIITPNAVQVHSREEMEYEPRACRIQNAASICYFLQVSTKPLRFIHELIISTCFILG
jgi:hypothetical protein